MKTIYLKLMGIILIFSMSACDNNQELEKFSLTGSYWAYESSISSTSKTYYHYYVWHFISEIEAEEVRYSTDTKQVDIKSGEDPKMYGDITDELYKTTIHVSSFNYPYITIYEKQTHKETGEVIIDDARGCDGEFLLNDKVLSVKFPISGYNRHFYRINK